jgi:hypothetical protein
LAKTSKVQLILAGDSTLVLLLAAVLPDIRQTLFSFEQRVWEVPPPVR